MVSEAASENPRLFQEHAHVAQFRELRLGHTAVVSQATSPFHEPAPSSVQAGTQLFLAPIHPSVPWPLPGHPEAMKMEPSPYKLTSALLGATKARSQV